MSYINKKEEVMQIELTQYGRHLLSKGKFKPKFYSFHDDDIIYDGKYINISEHQNDISKRIQESPRHNLRTSLVSSEKNNKKDGSGPNHKNLESFNYQSEEEKQLLLSSQLGHMVLGEQNTPHFIFNTTEDVINHGLGTKNKGVIHITGSNSVKIPQVDIEILYEILEDRVSKPNPEIFDSETFIDLLSEKVKFLDGTSLKLDMDGLTFELIEENAPYETENFEVQVFEVKKENQSQEELLHPIKKESELSSLFEFSSDESVSKEGLRPESTVEGSFFVKE